MRTREPKTVARPPAHTSVPIMACPILAAQRQDESPNTGLGQFLSFITHRMRLPNMPTPPAAAAPVIHGCRTPTRHRGGEGAPRPSRGRGATRHTPTSAAPHPASGWPRLARPHSPGHRPRTVPRPAQPRQDQQDTAAAGAPPSCAYLGVCRWGQGRETRQGRSWWGQGRGCSDAGRGSPAGVGWGGGTEGGGGDADLLHERRLPPTPQRRSKPGRSGPSHG